VTETAPRLSWGERGVDRARGETNAKEGGRGRYERERYDGGGRTDREDERRGGREGGRGDSWEDRRR